MNEDDLMNAMKPVRNPAIEHLMATLNALPVNERLDLLNQILPKLQTILKKGFTIKKLRIIPADNKIK